MAKIIKDDNESFPAMLERMQSEGDHGKMSKEQWDDLCDRYMKTYKEAKQSGSIMLLNWADLK